MSFVLFSRKTAWLPLLCVVGGMAVASTDPTGAARSEREKELEERVAYLESRLAHVESLLEQILCNQTSHTSRVVQSAPTAALEKRVTELEKQTEKLRGGSVMIPEWKDGLRFTSSDGKHQVKIGGRLHNDWFFGDEDDAVRNTLGPFDDGTEFRRARLYLKGHLYDRIEYKLQYDFAGGDADLKDAYVGITEFPRWGAGLRIGHFKEPFSLEEMLSTNNATFIERALPNTLVPSRNTGVMFHDSLFGDRATWAVGVFRDTDSYGNGSDGDGGGEYGATGRLTLLPLYRNDGRQLLHLGASFSHRNPDNGTLRLRTRPEAHQAPYFLDTGVFDADRVNLFGTEAAVVWGPASLQAEWIRADTRSSGTTWGDPGFNGYYLYFSYFLTGEHRPYKKTAGKFGRVEPKRNFLDGGCGALELAGRYSHLDLNDGLIRGGELDDYTLGLNWYWNPNTRVLFNYVYSEVEREDLRLSEDAESFQLRLQFNF